MPVTATKYTPPRVLVEPCWSPVWQLDESLSMPLGPDKVFGITARIVGNPKSRVLTKVTHYQAFGSDANTSDPTPASTRWLNLRGQGRDPNSAANSLELDVNQVVMTQTMEDGFTVAQAEQTLSNQYQRLVTAFGVTHPNQTNIIADYWDIFMESTHIEGLFPKTNSESGLANQYTALRAGMSSQTMARKLWDYGNRDFSGPETDYTRLGYNAYRNWYIGGYLNGPDRTAEDVRAYQTPYNLEKSILASPDSKVFIYGWPSFENAGGEQPILGFGDWPRIHFDSPAGDIMLNQLIQAAHATVMEDVFWALLIGNGWIGWDVFHQYSPDINDWYRTGFGETEFDRATWKTRWQPQGGQDYEYENAPQPKPSMIELPGSTAHDARRDRFPERPCTGEQGGACGAWYYSQIRNSVNNFVEFATFTYSKNGSQVNGYYNGTTPTNGSLGNARVSRQFAPNYGQDNIVRQAENELPIVLHGKGNTGKQCVIIKNKWAGVFETATYLITYLGVVHECTVTGRGLHVFQLDVSAYS